MTSKSAARRVSHPKDNTQSEPQTAPELSKVTNICLSQLVLSPANVRKTGATAAEDAELEASIRAKGILQNLIVHLTQGDGRSVYEVDAGGRRLKILQKLAADGVIENDHPVPCLIREPEASIETSLMENTVRAAMHPADEFVAMAELTDAGAALDVVAARFGTSERHVRQRLRLGKLAPELPDAYRACKISLDVVTAFTLGADHAAQLAVWNQLKANSYIQPYTVKRLLTESALPLDSSIGQFVGAEAYEAAGGTITRDLFSGDEDGFMDDAALVRRLAIEKLEAKAEELRAEWAWTKAVLDPEYRMLAQYARVEPKPAKVPADLADEIERIEQRLGELEEFDPDEFTDELMQEAARLEERRTEIDEIVDGLAVFSKKDRKRTGCIVTIGDDGRSNSIRALSSVRPPPRQTMPMSLTRRPLAMMTIPSKRHPRRGATNKRVPPSMPSRRCARNAASARCWSTISRRTACRSRADISPRISRSPSISRSIRSASISSSITATAHGPSICAPLKVSRAAR
jgi:ParB family chromosome partitioning protein